MGGGRGEFEVHGQTDRLTCVLHEARIEVFSLAVEVEA